MTIYAHTSLEEKLEALRKLEEHVGREGYCCSRCYS
jgi:hypothetical protein